MPIVPVAVIFTAMGITHLLRQHYRQIINWRLSGLFVLGCVAVIPNWTGSAFYQPAQAHYIHANSLMRQGKIMDALVQFRKAEKTDSKFPELQLNIGVALLTYGDTLNAMEAFRKEIKSNPGSFRAFNNIGVINECQDKLQTAMENYQESIRINSLFADGRENLGRIYLKVGDSLLNNGKIDSAAQKYELMLQLLPDDPKPLHRLALVALHLEDWDKAQKLLKENLLHHPVHNQSRMLLIQLDRHLKNK